MTQQVKLRGGERPAFADTDPFQPDRSDGDAGQRHDLVPEPSEHPPDLAVFPFGQDHFQNRRLPLAAHDTHPLGADFSFREPDALGQLIEDFSSRLSRHDHSVNLLDTELRVR